MNRVIHLFLLVFVSLRCSAQIKPAEGSELNYRIVRFSVPQVKESSGYKIEIAKGNYFSEDSFSQNVITTFPADNGYATGEVPAFNSSYTWRIVHRKGGGHEAGEFHHFRTGTVPNVDTAVVRLRILEHAKKYRDAYVFLDGNRALYDMQGNAVWYLPAKNGFQDEKYEVRDLQMTPQGTITFLLNDKAFEIDYDGNILWKGPDNGKVSGDVSEHYHHEFTRLSNGHYMLLGFEYAFVKKPSASDTSLVIYPGNSGIKDSSNDYSRAPLGTLLEYDKDSIVWSWRASDYLKGSDIIYRRRGGVLPDLAVHENSFFFDEKNKTIYVGFRNLSRIVKIKYPEGYALNTYGEIYKPNVPIKENDLFCRQHACRRSDDGYLYLFDNNVCNFSSYPKLVMLKEPEKGTGSLEKVWEYVCPIEGLEGQVKQNKYQFPVGGNAIELPDKSLLANMGGNYSKVFIVTKDKKILWSALPEKWDAKEKQWKPFYSYRTNIILNKRDLLDLVSGTAVAE